MMLSGGNPPTISYVDLPMLEEGKQDSIMERIVHHDEDFLPGASPVPLWITVTKEEFHNMTKLGNPDGSTQHVKIPPINSGK